MFKKSFNMLYVAENLKRVVLMEYLWVKAEFLIIKFCDGKDI